MQCKREEKQFISPNIFVEKGLRHSHTFEISANMGYFGVKGRALLMSPKGQNASGDGLVKLVVAICLLKFAYFVICFVLG